MKTLTELYKERDILAEDLQHIRFTAEKRGIYPYQDSFASQEYLELAKETVDRMNTVLEQIYALQSNLTGPEHFSRDRVFVWGGPTPSWGGSMARDASIKAAEYFGFENIMYVYGPHTPEMMDIHKGCRKLICHLGGNCRTEGAQTLGDVEEAENLCKLSLQFPNIIGGVVDDMIGNCGTRYSRKLYMAMHDALKSRNPSLELYGVVYTRELDDPRAKLLADCIDHVILWTWAQHDLSDLDRNLEKCRSLFPGKPIMMGVFMFDYGMSCLPASVASITYQLNKSREYLHAGKLQDIVILGDREIHKCPAVAKTVRTFFQDEFAHC